MVSALLLAWFSFGAAGDVPPVDPFRLEVLTALRATPRLAPKGRVQDTTYNQDVPIAELALREPERVVPHLIELIGSEEPLDPTTMDYWPVVHVGDVAFIVLVDLFTDRSWMPVAPELSWEALLDVPADDSGSTGYSQFADYLAARGRGALRSKWRSFWADRGRSAVWDPESRCFVLFEGESGSGLQDLRTPEPYGQVCVAPLPDYAQELDRDFPAKPAPRDPTYRFSVQIDEGHPVDLPTDTPLGLLIPDTAATHRVRIHDDGTLIESFVLDFEARGLSLCLTYTPGYQTWQLDPPRGQVGCGCWTE